MTGQTLGAAMSVDLWLARTFSVLAATMALGIAYGSGVVFRVYFTQFRAAIASYDPKSGLQAPAFNTHAVVIVTVAVALEAILFAILDVGQAFALVSEGWGAIVGIIGTLILPLLGYKSVQAVQASKGVNNVTGGQS